MATVNEMLRDEAIAHTVWISRYSTGVANRMVKLLNDSDAELTARLLLAMDSLPTSQFTVSRLESMLGSVRELNQQAIAGMQTSLADELLQLAGHEAGYQLSLFDSLLPQRVKERYPLQSITPEQLYAAAMAQPFQGRLLSEWADNLEADRMARVVNAMRRGYLQGDTTETIARQVRGIASKGYKDGALQLSRTNAASITKTAVNHLAATARTNFAEANGDVLKGKQWLPVKRKGTVTVIGGVEHREPDKTFTAIGVRTEYRPGEIDGTVIINGDMRIVFTADTELRTGDMVEVDGKWYRIEKPNPVNPGKLLLCYRAQLRA